MAKLLRAAKFVIKVVTALLVSSTNPDTLMLPERVPSNSSRNPLLSLVVMSRVSMDKLMLPSVWSGRLAPPRVTI